jgi:UPF0271 protein
MDAGLHVANEGFPDRNYNTDGTLRSRKEPDALIELPDEVAAHAVHLAKGGIDFSGHRVKVDTLCLHGDNVHAAQNAKLVQEALSKAGIQLQAI